MSYITAAELAQGAGMLQELAEPFGVAVDLMKATIAGGDRSAWSTEERAAADESLQAIEHTIERAAAEMNPYLVKRGYTFPVSASDFPVLAVWARNIFRYHHQPQRDLKTEETGRIERDYQGALKALRQVADGVLPLGENDPVFAGAGGAGSPDFVDCDRVFSRDTLRDF